MRSVKCTELWPCTSVIGRAYRSASPRPASLRASRAGTRAWISTGLILYAIALSAFTSTLVFGGRSWAASDPILLFLLAWSSARAIRDPRLCDTLTVVGLSVAVSYLISGIYNGFTGALLNQVRIWVFAQCLYIWGRVLVGDPSTRRRVEIGLLLVGLILGLWGTGRILLDAPTMYHSLIRPYGELPPNEWGFAMTLLSLYALGAYSRTKGRLSALASLVCIVAVFASLSRNAILCLLFFGPLLSARSSRLVLALSILLGVVLFANDASALGALSPTASGLWTQKVVGIVDDLINVRLVQINVQSAQLAWDRPLGQVLFGDGVSSGLHSVWPNALVMLGVWGALWFGLYYATLVRKVLVLNRYGYQYRLGLALLAAMTVSDSITNMRNTVMLVAYLFALMMGLLSAD